MQLIHAAVSEPDISFWLWAEAAGQHHSGGLWPFCIAGIDLKALLHQAFGLRSDQNAEIRAWLPVIGNDPIPSTPLIENYPKETSKDGYTLRRWTIPAERISFDLATALFASLEKAITDSGIFCAPDLLYWSEAIRFGLHLIITEKYIPSLNERIPLWRPVILGDDRRRFEQLSRAMPDACHVFTQDIARTPETIAKRSLLSKFVEAVINGVIHDSEIAPSPRSTKLLHDQWLRALADSSMPPAFPRFSDNAVASMSCRCGAAKRKQRRCLPILRNSGGEQEFHLGGAF